MSRTAPRTTQLASWAGYGATCFGLIGAIAGLILGLRAYPPTAWFAVLEVGVPAAIVGAALGTATGFLACVRSHYASRSSLSR